MKKYLRYIAIAVLIYVLATTIYSAISPKVFLSDGTQPGQDTITAFISHYRMLLLPWILLNAVILVGWLFSRHRVVVYSVLLIAAPLLAYLAFINIRKLGYTLEQSVTAFLQGQGGAMTGWMIFSFIALAALPFFMRFKGEQIDAGDAHSASA